MHLLDRLVTIVATATLTSAVWIVAGGTILDRAGIASSFASPGATTAVRRAPPPPSAPVPQADSGKLVIPVRGKGPKDLTDTFTAARAGGARVHDAIDIMADEGTPVIAAMPGRVEKLFLSKPGGNTIYIRSTDGRTIYYYAHLRDYAPGLAEGEPVIAGQSLGSVGHTGNASPDEPHLHFAIMRTTPDAKWYQPATAINPYPLLTAR